MAPQKTYRPKRRAVRRYNKKARLSKSLDTVALGKGFPKKLIMTHKYSERTTITNTAGVINYHNMSVNSVYDPNATGSGHQPLYYDQLNVIYGRYVVIASKAKVTFFPSTLTNVPAQVCLFINDDTNVTDNVLSYVSEQPSSKVRYLPANTTDFKTLSTRFSAKKTFGKGYLNNPAYYAAPGANPTTMNYFTLAVQPYDASSNYTLNAVWEMEYTVMWCERNDVATS